MTETPELESGIQSLSIESIAVCDRLRAIDHDRLETLVESMQELGLMHPIHVRMDTALVDADGEAGTPVLVAGAHRLLAAKKLGWSHIDCKVLVEDRGLSEMWEIAENLHRVDLTKDQRDEQIRRYATLLEHRELQSRQSVAFESQRDDGRGHRRKGVTATISEETGLSQRTIQRAMERNSKRNTKGIAKAKSKSKIESKAKTQSVLDCAEIHGDAGLQTRCPNVAEEEPISTDPWISEEVLNDTEELRRLFAVVWQAVEVRDRTWLKRWIVERIDKLRVANDDMQSMPTVADAA